MAKITPEFLDTLTEEERKLFESQSDEKKQKRERIMAIKEAAQAISNATYAELDNGERMTVADRAVLAAYARVIQEGDVKGLVDLAKITGDFKQEVEVKVSDLEKMLEKVSGDKF
jgi:hypothetical protein